jgi:hypothetical protein
MENSMSNIQEFLRIVSLPIKNQVNELGGYGADGEVIYTDQPDACPSVLVDKQGFATATAMSNGSLELSIQQKDEMKIDVLRGHFDPVEKREVGVPSTNVWFSQYDSSGKLERAASLMNPVNNILLDPESIRIVKLGDPERAVWYCAEFSVGAEGRIQTAIRIGLKTAAVGSVLTRDIYVQNTGKEQLDGILWTLFHLQGTQEFNYNKQSWYDSALPVNDTTIVASAVVPYRESMQIKRITSACSSSTPSGATCDYLSFIGNSAALSLMPEAVKQGDFIPKGAGKAMNRFATPTIAASKFTISLNPGQTASVQQELLYVTDKAVIAQFKEDSSCAVPAYSRLSEKFAEAAENLAAVPLVFQENRQNPGALLEKVPFWIALPHQQIVAEYANSVWTTVSELYENCRAHGAMLADGIELGTRDRGQDMWPKMKEDPGRVREDLVYTLSFMYRTGFEEKNTTGKLSLQDKLHGMFPRQFPSRWLNRSQEVMNDNRPYTDSSLWLVNSLCMYIRETGDLSILLERVGSIRLTNPEVPEKSGIVDGSETFFIAEVVAEIFSSFMRHIADSPYGMVQILFGDWCDPIDMYGTSEVGQADTRGKGRGTQARLSAHLFICLVEYLDIVESNPAAQRLIENGITIDYEGLRSCASELRQSIVKTAWQDSDVTPGFINVIHELRADSTVPDYESGEIGYTLGSMTGSDYDGIARRELTTQAYCLEMLRIERSYLQRIDNTGILTDKLLNGVAGEFYRENLGLVMFSKPMANNRCSIDMVGRMGVLPAGTAENGEYHHGQVFMHLFRLRHPDQANIVWEQFKPILSAMRDGSLGGPFETPATSYVSDVDDPHYGMGMYFGLSGSIDWIVEVFQQIAGIKLNLHDNDLPDVQIDPVLPDELRQNLTFKRIVHVAAAKTKNSSGSYRTVPISIAIRNSLEAGKGNNSGIWINGKKCDKAVVDDISQFDKVDVEIIYDSEAHGVV